MNSITTVSSCLLERRSEPLNTWGLDVEVDAEIVRVMSGRRKVGFISIAPGEYATWVYEYDQRSGNSLPRYTGWTATLDDAIRVLATIRRAQVEQGKV
jgi:hypothetical protein